MDRLKTGLNSKEIQRTCMQNVRIPIYGCLVILCSLTTISEDFKIDKRNFLNQWFVKLGWFWTTVLILPLMFNGIKVDDRLNVSKGIFRFIFSTSLWYVSTNFFQILDDTTGIDISGHTFLLIFSNLLITSELELTDKNNGLESMQHVRIASVVLRGLWDFMLVQTALYYHTIWQKSIAALWAVVSWYLLHLFFYRGANGQYSPKLPSRT